jgi:hypothetical protein
MKHRLRVIEVRKNQPMELPDDAIPLRLERVIEPNGLVNPSPSPDKFMLYYLQKEV